MSDKNIPTPQPNVGEKKVEMRVVLTAPAYMNKRRYQMGEQIVLANDIDFVPAYMHPIGWEPTKLAELKKKKQK